LQITPQTHKLEHYRNISKDKLKNNRMNKEQTIYESPQVEFIEVDVEKGFATSYESEDLGW